MKRLLLILLLPIQLAFGQSDVKLDSCYLWARENYPSLKQSELWKEISALNQESIKTSHLPQVSLNGKISYQSAVTQLPISIPGITMPSVSKDRYNAYAELQQNIWDGGIAKANKDLESAILNNNMSRLEVELYTLNEQVALAFFTALIVDQQKAVIRAQIETIKRQLTSINSGIKNGVIEKSAALVLQAEILKLEQNAIEFSAAKSTTIRMLSILTGRQIAVNTALSYNNAPANFKASLLRPELQLFANQRAQLDTQKDLLSKNRNPKLYGYGQLGYGKPGLNMLLDEFKGYYLLGVGISWNAFDWKNTTRKKQVLQLQQDIIEAQEQTFAQNIELLLVQQKEQISKLETMLNNDEKLVALRTDITKSSASKLENETITSSDYIREVQAETISKLNLELHKIQLHQAREKYNIIQGK